MTIGNYVEAKDSLISVSGAYYMDMGKFGEKTLEIQKFNKYYFNSSIDLISYVIVVFEDYVHHCLKIDNNIGIIDFLRDSVKKKYI